jgi:hypothetical protein
MKRPRFVASIIHPRTTNLLLLLSLFLLVVFFFFHLAHLLGKTRESFPPHQSPPLPRMLYSADKSLLGLQVEHLVGQDDGPLSFLVFGMACTDSGELLD